MATKRKRVILETIMHSVELNSIDYLYDCDFCWLWGFVRLIGRELKDCEVNQFALALYDSLNFINPALVGSLKRDEITEQPESIVYCRYRPLIIDGLKKSMKRNPLA